MFIKEPGILLRDLKNVSRQQVRTVTSLLTRQGRLQKHSHTIGVSDTLICRKCGETEETTYHLLSKCNSMATQRLLVMGKSFPDPKDITNMDVKYRLRTARQSGIFQHV